jgi:ABC-2 type transport system permease protein
MKRRSYVLSDTLTMLRRVILHMLRNPFVTILSTLATPILMLVMMYNLFGGVVQQADTMSSGTRYIDFLTPGLILITSIYGMGTAALRANADATQGIITRFRTMSIARASVLNGHVIGSSIGTLFSISVVIGLAFLTGFHPTADVGDWLAACGLIVLFVTALTWLAVALGVSSKSPEATNSGLYLLFILPFLSNAFVPTDSMTPAVAWIAENQPFSPIIDTLRGLLLGTPIGNRGLIAAAWCVGFAAVGSLWAQAAYDRSSNR